MTHKFDNHTKQSKIIEAVSKEMKDRITLEVDGMKYTKNFRSATAEEWYVFLPNYQDPLSGGAAGKTIVQYDIFDNKHIFINTTIILDDPSLHHIEQHALVYAISEEIINRLVGYANTLLSVHCGANSYQAEYKH